MNLASMRLTVIVIAVFGFSTVGSAKEKLQSQECKSTSEAEIAALFDRWNDALKTGDPEKVVANYAEDSILLPTVSNKPRITVSEKLDYFEYFVKSEPSGVIDMSIIQIGCNTAVDAGLYTFKLGKTGDEVSGRYTFTYRWDGSAWLITSHHSSEMPEIIPADI